MTKSLSMRRRKFILALLALVEFRQEAAGKDRAAIFTIEQNHRFRRRFRQGLGKLKERKGAIPC
jgi:hypothetical protein